ncbi:putative F-box protein At3g25750 [Cornus florida]|uniref:putative F-box protein At3g25750 n=1 Tax=Cornus florida TaxID=4283 RepID=UPI00289CDAD7|nr:putative F-box protein At3g25750 [Cornus florida]
MGSVSESNWAWLPNHLLDMILDNLVSLSDYIRFGAVCKEWQSLAIQNKVQFFKKNQQVPLLMVPTEDNSEERRSLYSITHNKLYDFQLRVPYKKRFCGSSHGWLFTVEESFALTLINPFCGATIELLPVIDSSKFKPHNSDNDSDDDTTQVEVEFVVKKVALLADRALSVNDYIVSAIYDNINERLAFIQPGDKFWTYTDRDKFNSAYEDVIYYKGQILAIDLWGRIKMINLNRSARESKVPQQKVITLLQTYRVNQMQMYLVESFSGNLLVVERYLKYIEDQLATSVFKVFKILLQQTEEGLAKRVEMKNLCGDSLFLGNNHSICVSSSNWPRCQPNSIYYTDDYIDFVHHSPYGRRDIGIFNIENGSFGTHYILDPSHKHMLTSIWIVMVGN